VTLGGTPQPPLGGVRAHPCLHRRRLALPGGEFYAATSDVSLAVQLALTTGLRP